MKQMKTEKSTIDRILSEQEKNNLDEKSLRNYVNSQVSVFKNNIVERSSLKDFFLSEDIQERFNIPLSTFYGYLNMNSSIPEKFFSFIEEINKSSLIASQNVVKNWFKTGDSNE